MGGSFDKVFATFLTMAESSTRRRVPLSICARISKIDKQLSASCWWLATSMVEGYGGENLPMTFNRSNNALRMMLMLALVISVPTFVFGQKKTEKAPPAKPAQSAPAQHSQSGNASHPGTSNTSHPGTSNASRPGTSGSTRPGNNAGSTRPGTAGNNMGHPGTTKNENRGGTGNNAGRGNSGNAGNAAHAGN